MSKKPHPLEPQVVEWPLLALDVGQSRIGFAWTDQKGLVFPRGYMLRSNLGTDIETIRAKMLQERARMLVVGLPLRTDGKPSAQAQRVRALGHALRLEGIPLFYQDERFTTQMARQDLGSKASLGEIDAQSAVRILEMFVERFLEPLE